MLRVLLLRQTVQQQQVEVASQGGVATEQVISAESLTRMSNGVYKCSFTNYMQWMQLFSTTTWRSSVDDFESRFDKRPMHFTLPMVDFVNGESVVRGKLFKAATPPWCESREHDMRAQYLTHGTTSNGVQIGRFIIAFACAYQILNLHARLMRPFFLSLRRHRV